MQPLVGGGAVAGFALGNDPECVENEAYTAA